jgi:hypothetical protein
MELFVIPSPQMHLWSRVESQFPPSKKECDAMETHRSHVVSSHTAVHHHARSHYSSRFALYLPHRSTLPEDSQARWLGPELGDAESAAKKRVRRKRVALAMSHQLGSAGPSETKTAANLGLALDPSMTTSRCPRFRRTEQGAKGKSPLIPETLAGEMCRPELVDCDILIIFEYHALHSPILNCCSSR